MGELDCATSLCGGVGRPGFGRRARSWGCVADGSRRGYERALAGPGVDIGVAPHGAEAVTHVLQPDAFLGAVDVEAAAVVAHLETDLIGP